jgi:glycosyltransferase involved in cell wall biosynthesis
MRPLKICLATTFYPPFNFGGDGIFVYRLSNVLAQQGHKVHVIHDVDAFNMFADHPSENSYPHHENVTLHPLKEGRLGSIDLLMTHQLGRPILKSKQVKSILEGSDFDVIHFHNVSLLGGPDVLTYGEAIKFCTLHDDWFVCAMHVLWRFDREPCSKRTCLACTLRGRRPPQLWRYTGRLKHTVQHVDAFIGPSKFVKDIHQAHGFPAPIRHIPHFVPQTELEEAEKLYRQKLPPDRPYFLFVGRLEKIKGVQVLLEVFRHYREADLLIAGTGSYRDQLVEFAKGLPHIHFLGLLDHEQLRSLYGQAIATLIPSICYETFGWPVVESFSMRTPVIAHDLSAPAEMVLAADGGLVYKTKEELLAAIETLHRQPKLQSQLGEKGYQSVLENYTEEHHLNSYYDLIDEVEKTRARRPRIVSAG